MQLILQFVVLIFLIVFSESVKFRCDYRYTHLGWFKYHEIPMTWQDARLQCSLEGGILASPTTAAMKSIMLESFCKPKIFTGIHATFSKGHYYSVGGIPLDQIPHEWTAYEPDNKNNAENCLALHSDGKLSDVRCDEPHPYVCYRANSNIDVNACGTTDSEYHFEEQTNKCYKFHTNPTTFAQAHSICSAEGGHLAIINSDQESRVISQIFAKYPASKIPGNFYKDVAFIGFLSWQKNADWTTIHGQSIHDAGFAKFSSGQPDNLNHQEYCGSVYRSGLLNDAECEASYAFICEKYFADPAVCDNVNVPNETKYARFCDNDVHDQATRQDTDPINIDVRSGPTF